MFDKPTKFTWWKYVKIEFINQMVYNVTSLGAFQTWRIKMKTSDMIKKLCNKKNISVSELARRIGQTPQNFGKKLKRDTVTIEELKQIADVMEVTFEQSFVFPDGEQIRTSNEQRFVIFKEKLRSETS